MAQMTAPPALFRASAPADTVLAELGPLADLPGTWVGKGFHMISVPDFQQGQTFRLAFNATQETLNFTALGGLIPDRGSLQDDITFLGLHYFQQVSDATTSGALHVEAGLWLNLPSTTNPHKAESVARLSTIPHGDSLLAQGPHSVLTSFPINSANSIPFTLDSRGSRINVTDPQYLAPFFNAQLPPGIPVNSQFDPNLVLQQVITSELQAGKTFPHTVQLFVNARPVGGINGTPIHPKPEDVGGIVNIPFIKDNANANSFSALLWIETVQNPDGSQFLQLQYTQTTILEFSNLLWPHIAVATLIKQ